LLREEEAIVDSYSLILRGVRFHHAMLAWFIIVL